MPRFPHLRAVALFLLVAALAAASAAYALARPGETPATPAAPQAHPSPTSPTSTPTTLPGLGPDGQPEILRPEDVDRLTLPDESLRDELKRSVEDSHLPRFFGTLGSITFADGFPEWGPGCLPVDGVNVDGSAARGTPLDLSIPPPPGLVVVLSNAGFCDDELIGAALVLEPEKPTPTVLSPITVLSFWQREPQATPYAPRSRMRVVPIAGIEVVVEDPVNPDLLWSRSRVVFAVPHPKGGYVVTDAYGQASPDILLDIAKAIIELRQGVAPR